LYKDNLDEMDPYNKVLVMFVAVVVVEDKQMDHFVE
jgi:hypothetical protein